MGNGKRHDTDVFPADLAGDLPDGWRLNREHIDSLDLPYVSAAYDDYFAHAAARNVCAVFCIPRADGRFWRVFSPQGRDWSVESPIDDAPVDVFVEVVRLHEVERRLWHAPTDYTRGECQQFQLFVDARFEELAVTTTTETTEQPSLGAFSTPT